MKFFWTKFNYCQIENLPCFQLATILLDLERKDMLRGSNFAAADPSHPDYLQTCFSIGDTPT